VIGSVVTSGSALAATAFAPLQRQQAELNAAQAEQRAQALRNQAERATAEADVARTEAEQADRRAVDLNDRAGTARSEADRVTGAVRAAQGFDRLGEQQQQQLEQINQGAAPESSAPPAESDVVASPAVSPLANTAPVYSARGAFAGVPVRVGSQVDLSA